MKPREEIEKIFENFGQTMSLKNSKGETFFKAFLQPLRYKNKMYLNAVSTELRYDSSKKYLLLAPITVDLKSADGYEAILHGFGNKYVIDRSEVIFLSGEPIYTWSVVTAI